MHNIKGIGLFEMILSLILFSIIAGVITMLFANPLQDWIKQKHMLNQMDELKACLNVIARDLAKQNSVEVQNSAEGINLLGHAQIADNSVTYRFLKKTHLVQRKSQAKLETLLMNTDATLTPFTSTTSQGLVITLRTTQKTQVQLAMPVLIAGE